jgi:hypothetical protein
MGIRRPISAETKCGCIYCEEIFPFAEITAYVDDGLAPLCTRCGIDSVILESAERSIDQGLLRRMHIESFG